MAALISEAEHNFNSSVVRLRVRRPFFASRLKPLFQFQCGAIEGTLTQGCVLIRLLFQFQCGAIEGFMNKNTKQIQSAFQFQCGAIEGFHLLFLL